MEEEKKLNEEKLLSLTADLEKQEKSHLEISNQLRFDLDATKVLLVEAKVDHFSNLIGTFSFQFFPLEKQIGSFRIVTIRRRRMSTRKKCTDIVGK